MPNKTLIVKHLLRGSANVAKKQANAPVMDNCENLLGGIGVGISLGLGSHEVSATVTPELR